MKTQETVRQGGKNIFEDLKLPPVLKDVIMTKRGLVLFVGGTGSGKSTSLAAMLGYRNENSYGHIITIEDPVEYVHPHKNCLITQREVGVDTDSWHAALKNTLPMFSTTGRMDPKGAQAVLDVFSQSSADVAKAKIDLSKTYTNRFVEAAGKGRALIVHTATGRHLRQLEALFGTSVERPAASEDSA